MRIYRSLIFYGFLTCLWLAIAGWQVVEHDGLVEASRTGLINRARDISNTLAALVRSQTRREGFVGQDRLENVLKELVESEEIRAVALLNSACEIIVQAGSGDLDSQNLPDDGARWEKGKVTFVNLIDLGASEDSAEAERPREIIIDDNDMRRGARMNRESFLPPDEPDSEGMQPRRGGRRFNDENGGLREAIRDVLNPEAREAMRGGPPDGPRLGRPMWMSQERYDTLSQQRGLHGFMLSISTGSMDAAILRDRNLRYLIAGFALLAVLGAGFTWHSLKRSRDELEERVQQRTAELNVQLIERKRAEAAVLQKQQQLSNELAEAAEYVRSLLPRPLSGAIATEWSFIPSAHLGGDAFGYHWIDENRFAFYLLDVCGHGVKAALLSVSVINTIRTQSLPRTDFSNPAEVLKSLNRAYPMSDNHGMYFTMWYGVYDISARCLRHSGGGHPPALLVYPSNGSPAASIRLDSGGTVIGAYPNLTYECYEREIKGPGKIFVFSDGVFEVRGSSDTTWGFDALEQLICVSADSSVSDLDRIRDEVYRVNGRDELEDDYSTIMIAIS